MSTSQLQLLQHDKTALSMIYKHVIWLQFALLCRSLLRLLNLKFSEVVSEKVLELIDKPFDLLLCHGVRRCDHDVISAETIRCASSTVVDVDTIFGVFPA